MNKSLDDKYRRNRRFIREHRYAATAWGVHHDPIEVAANGSDDECAALVRSIRWRWAMQMVIGVFWVLLLSSLFVRH